MRANHNMVYLLPPQRIEQWVVVVVIFYRPASRWSSSSYPCLWSAVISFGLPQQACGAVHCRASGHRPCSSACRTCCGVLHVASRLGRTEGAWHRRRCCHCQCSAGSTVESCSPPASVVIVAAASSATLIVDLQAPAGAALVMGAAERQGSLGIRTTVLPTAMAAGLGVPGLMTLRFF